MKPSILRFLALAYGISWSIYALAKWVFGVTGALGWTVAAGLFMFGPALAALALRKRDGLSWEQWGLSRKGIRWKWMGLALALALAVPVLTLGVDRLLGDGLGITGFGHTEVSKAMVLRTVQEKLEGMGGTPQEVATTTDRMAALPLNGALLLLVMLLGGALAGCTVNLLFALGEEAGWRGHLYALTRHWGLWKQVLFTGCVWGLWHAPLILEGHNYPEHPRLGVAFMCLLTLALALPMAWVRRRSGSVLAPALLHGTVNGTAGIILIFTSGTHDMLGGAAGLAVVLALALLGAALCIFDPELPRSFRQ